jgi:transposase
MNAASTVGKKIKGRKRHIVTDVCGNLLAANVHAANIHDTKAGGVVFAKACEKHPTIDAVGTDAGYRKTFELLAQALGKKVFISQRLDPKKWALLPGRWVVERTFAWLCNNRRLAKDFELTVASSVGFIFLANALTILKRHFS